MEYEFINDPITRYAKAKFSLEHEVFGPWIEVELGNNIDKLTQLLTAIEEAEKSPTIEQKIVGHEYTLTIEEKEVSIAANVSLNGAEALPEALAYDDMGFDDQQVAGCGLEDFHQLLLAWARFTTH
jgi:uncharacterized protein YacL (UPF0231 family)